MNDKILTNSNKIDIFHILRDPCEVYKSLLTSGNKFVQFFNSNPFNIRDIAMYIYYYYGIPNIIVKNLFEEKIYFYRTIVIFTVAWTYCNYIALKTLEANKKIENIIIYNHLYNEKYREYIESLLRKKGIKIKFTNTFKPRKRNENFISIVSIKNMADKLGISKKFKYVMGFFNLCS